MASPASGKNWSRAKLVEAAATAASVTHPVREACLGLICRR
ncbi:hypothetical protein CPter91_1843 [Collimonas pratensis]|uniref:Uncharacterized protein n=1 Tax=Collimonas pratensis TaxID=279113 RepID=A0A127Q2J8_9BURK|nr:hypothetical protein CPter91_1843 [Collimonas pratensis]